MSRNQTWQSDGTLIQDYELYREAGVAKHKDWLTGIVRNASTEEAAAIAADEQSTKREAARIRVMADIKANATQSPWGRILSDLAVAQGWIEP